MHGTIDTGFDVEVRRLDDIALVAPELAALTARALAPNVFYEPAFVAAAATVFGRDAVAGLVWRRGLPRRLVGFFPATFERRRYLLPIPAMTGWTHPFGPLGTPPVDRDCAPAAIAAWFDHLAGDKALPKLLLMPQLPADGIVAQAFDAALAKRGGRSAEFDRHARALLAPVDDRAGYLDRAMTHRRRKELGRQRRRLADAGALTTTLATEPAAVAAALDDFLALEAAGWKGRAGTAARQNPAVCAFVTAAVAALAADGKVAVTRLALDGRAIAAAVTLRSGDEAWGWKIAYDERYARYSPGVQCLVDVTRALLADPHVARADSCATPDHPMIDHLWRERRALSDRLFCIAPCDETLFAHVCKMEALRRTALGWARWARNLVRRR